MRPEQQSNTLLSITRSTAKMYEYSIPEEFHIDIPRDPARLLTITIGILGDYVALYKNDTKYLKNSAELKRSLMFSAQYFDSYIQSKLNHSLDPYLLLIGSATYYLCDLPGSSNVLAARLTKCPDLECDGLEKLLHSLLLNKADNIDTYGSKNFKEPISLILSNLVKFYLTGESVDLITNESKKLYETVYQNGSARQLLISDIINAVLKKRIFNSTWSSISRYSDINITNWKEVISKKTFIKEFWPSQLLLGEKDVFKGKSAIIQMPTSAGKTKSIEIIIRSSFISDRSNLAVIVAPFRALCSEIKNNLAEAFEGEKVDIDTPSDVFQADFDFLDDFDLTTNKLILVVTPEKLMYMLRHSPEIADEIGLIVYDEGHQFDSGLRGVTYELLISSLKRLIPQNIQTILISAVISNADAIGAWLNGEDGEIVTGTNLLPTYRTVAFTSWYDQRGRLEFVDQHLPEKHEYFVPRVIEQSILKTSSREKEKKFPEKLNGKSIALYLGIKLVKNGSVAIFCGTKATVAGLCDKAVEIYKRGYEHLSPNNFSDPEEIERLTFLHSRHFGDDYVLTKSSSLGIYAHSGNTPQGLRLAIEYAMQKSKIKFVICTSTLAQGVNLPIKYLIVTSVYQAGEKIKTRDFHNLIGRAGRSGMHTEGSILFADSEVYDKKGTAKEGWKWIQVKDLLDAKNSEPCISTLLSIFNPIVSDNKSYKNPIDLIHFIETYFKLKDLGDNLIGKISIEYVDANFSIDNVTWQIKNKIDIISAIESYLMAHWDDSIDEINEEDVVTLAKGTLAYSLSSVARKVKIIELFKLLASNINLNFKQSSKRKAYGKTLFGVKDMLELENWTFENFANLMLCETSEQLLSALWPILSNKISNKAFKKMLVQKHLLQLSIKWMHGNSYFELFNYFLSLGARIKYGKKSIFPKQETIIEICDNAFAFDATLIISAIREIVEFEDNDEYSSLIDLLNNLQKRIKYGLSNSLAIAFYEIGFSDRVIASELAQKFDMFSDDRYGLTKDIKANLPDIQNTINKYPTYYSYILNEINIR